MERKFSFRGHRAAVSCIISFQNDIVSADRDGFVAVWDIYLKRPKAVWKAHEGHILTLQSTPLGLLSHGRDSSIRIWKPPFTDLSTEFPQEGNTTEKVSVSKAPSCCEIPVNSLNFCNVAYCNGRLATPATRNSENFDIYSLLDDFSLLRIVEDYGTDGPTQTDGKRAGSGIVMRMLFVEELLLFVGYESGCVKGFRLKNDLVSVLRKNDHLVMNKPIKVLLVMEEDAHTPHPVLSLEYDPTTCRLYSGSASKKLMEYSIGHLVGNNDGEIEGKGPLNQIGQKREKLELGNTDRSIIDGNTVEAIGNGNIIPENTQGNMDSQIVTLIDIHSYNLHHYGIQNLHVGKVLVAGFWDGIVAVLNQKMETIGELSRAEEVIKPEYEDQQKTLKKSLCLHVWQPVRQENSTSRRALVRQRRAPTTCLLFVGYGDGLISAYALNN